MRLSRRSVLCAAAVIAASPLRAQAPGPWGWPEVLAEPEPDPVLDRFDAMMRRIPALLVTPGIENAVVAFGDLAAARSVDDGSGGAAARRLRVMIRGLPPAGASQDLGEDEGDWRRALGMTIDDVEQLLLFASPPRMGSVMALAPGTGARVTAALTAAGYTPQTRDGVTALSVGEDDRIDFAARTSGDPLRGRIGRSSRVQIDGDLLRHASTWPLLGALAGPVPVPALQQSDLAVLRGALAGLGAGPLLTALILPDATPLRLADPFAALTGGDAGGSAQAWRALLLADLSTGPRSTAVLAMTLDWPAGESLVPLAGAIAQRWAGDPALGGTFGPAEVETGQGAQGPAWMRLSLSAPTETVAGGWLRNGAYQRLTAMVLQGRLDFLP